MEYTSYSQLLIHISYNGFHLRVSYKKNSVIVFQYVIIQTNLAS